MASLLYQDHGVSSTHEFAIISPLGPRASAAIEEFSFGPNLAPQAVERRCRRTELCTGPRAERGIVAAF